MSMDDISRLVTDLLIVLLAGLLAGLLCKRWGISLLVGYLAVGALIGTGGLGLVTQHHGELEHLASVGALMLLFAIGIEFSLDELLRLSRYFLIGGAVQMVLVAIPLTLLSRGLGMSWNAAVLVGSAGALSSTVLVFKALTEWGQTATPHGRRAIGILLFQDVALVPLMLLVPLLTTNGAPPSLQAYGLLAGKSLFFVAAVFGMRRLIETYLVPYLAKMRSVEIVVLFSLSVLGTVCWSAVQLGLPAAIGALAGGIMLSGNRLSQQIDTILLPFRESFATVFFVTLGTLLQPADFFREPILLTAALAGMLLLKTSAAGIAFRLIGLRWPAAIGMGLGLAQLGEFSFLVLAEGMKHGVISSATYSRLLFVALGTLLLTPQLLKLGLKWTGGGIPEHVGGGYVNIGSAPVRHAVVVGIGPIGRQIASRLEIAGVHVCLIDFSPVNLYPFSQQGFQTVAGDARDPEVLRRALADRCSLAVISVPEDESAHRIVKTLREMNPTGSILVRCRYQSSISRARKAGANTVVSEEAEASGALLRHCEELIAAGATIGTTPLG
ncbi:MAG: cation:proton antiporter [Planctomycetaceae bacterium]|nr:cation:proton antiporter [Planctomycetaceae bacterium]